MKKVMKILLMIIFLMISLFALNTEPKIPYETSDGFVSEWLATVESKINE